MALFLPSHHVPEQIHPGPSLLGMRPCCFAFVVRCKSEHPSYRGIVARFNSNGAFASVSDRTGWGPKRMDARKGCSSKSCCFAGLGISAKLIKQFRRRRTDVALNDGTEMRLQEAPGWESIISLVAANFGISIIPASTQLLRNMGVAYRPLQEAAPTFDLALAWLSDDNSPVVQNFLQVARKQ